MLIDAISKVRDVLFPSATRKEKIEPARKGGTDTVIISDEGRERVEKEKAINTAKEIVRNTPDIREEKVNMVKERMESGYYENEEVIQKTAQKVMEDVFSSI